MDWNNFWTQVFYPLNQIGIIFFSVLIALLVSKLMDEMEDADFLEINKFKNAFTNGLFTFILRFIFAFIITILIVFLIILILSLVLAGIGFIQLKLGI